MGPASASSGSRREAAAVLVLAAVYLTTAKLGLRFATVHPSATPIWPPTGLSIAALLLLGGRVWPGVFLGAFLANVTTDGNALTSAGIAAGNTLEALLAAMLVRRYAGGAHAFDRAQDIFTFTGLAAVASTTVSATIGVTTLTLGGYARWDEFGPIWNTWWLGDALGALIAAPLLLLWAQPRPLPWRGRALLERAVFLIAFLGVTWLLFSARRPLAYLAIPFMIWSAFRFERRETAAVIALFSLVALRATIHGLGPFVAATRNDSLLLVQGFIGVTVLVALPLASVIAEREAADLERSRRERTQRLLAKAGAVLGASLDPEQTLRGIAALAVPALADWCIVRLLAEDGRLRRLAVFYQDPGGTGPAAEWTEAAPMVDMSDAVAAVIGTRRPHLVPEIMDADLPATVADPAIRDALVRDGRPSAMIVPLVTQDRALGVITFLSARSGRRYGAADLALGEELAHRAAMAVDNARLHQAAQRERAEAERTAHRMQRLQAVTAALSEALTPAQVAEVILTQGAGALRASAGVVYRLRKDEAVLEMLHTTGYPEEVAARWARNPVAGASPSTQVARTGAAAYFESLDAVVARYPGLAGKVNPMPGGRAFVPLVVDREVIGVLGFVFAQLKTFSAEERGFVQALADQCAQALERSRLFEAQRTVADTLQRAFLPLALPQVPAVRLSAAYLPAATDSSVGGDWYDAFALPDGRIAVCVGDAVGHGLDAAVIMGQMRQCIRAAALDDSDPSSVLSKANRVLVHSHGARTMATALFGVLDPGSLVLTYASAGHPPPMLRRPDGTVIRLPGGTLPLGIVSEISPDRHELALAPGADVVLYTDGLVELTRNIEEGEAVLRAAVAAPRPQPVDAAQEIVAAVVGGRLPADDIAVLAMGIDSAPFEGFAITVPAEPDASRLIRRTLRRLAAALRMGEEPFTALEVAVGEAVNNAVEHAYGSSQGTVEVRARREDNVLHVEVEDHGRWRAERDEGRGHGLRLMHRLVDEAEVERRPAGTIVRLRLRFGEAHDARSPLAPAPALEHVPAAPPPPLDGPSRGPVAPRPPATGPAAQPSFGVELVRQVPVLRVAGDVDLGNEDAFLQALENAAQYDRRAVVVSLAGVSYIDSRGMHALLRFGARLSTNRRYLLLVAPRVSLAGRLLAMMGGSAAAPVFETVDEAIAEVETLPATLS